MTKRLFLDLDGVLVDFDRHCRIVLGFEPTHVNRTQFWAAVEACEDFWHDMPMMPGARLMWDTLKPYNPTILTALPRTQRSQAETQKRLWVAKHLDPLIPVITVTRSSDKRYHCTQPGDVLVDDRPMNCAGWNAHGGRAVLFSDPVSATAEALALLTAKEVA